MEIKIIKLENGVYQIEAGKKAVVIPAHTRKEAIKKACKYLRINCNKIIAKSFLKA